MWIEVYSPHSGRTVRVRDKDVGRSVRDENGHIFFVLPRSDGEGHYSSVTRAGGPKQEQAYLEMIAKQDHARASGKERSASQIHDATGAKRNNIRGKLVILVFVVMVLGLLALWLFTVGPLGNTKWQAPPILPQPIPAPVGPPTLPINPTNPAP